MKDKQSELDELCRYYNVHINCLFSGSKDEFNHRVASPTKAYGTTQFSLNEDEYMTKLTDKQKIETTPLKRFRIEQMIHSKYDTAN